MQNIVDMNKVKQVMRMLIAKKQVSNTKKMAKNVVNIHSSLSSCMASASIMPNYNYPDPRKQFSTTGRHKVIKIEFYIPEEIEEAITKLVDNYLDSYESSCLCPFCYNQRMIKNKQFVNNLKIK